MFENPRRGRQARNFTTNAPKILLLKSSSEQIFSRKLRLGAPGENASEWFFLSQVGRSNCLIAYLLLKFRRNMLKLMFKSIHSVQTNLSYGNLSPFKISLYWLVTERRYWKHAHLCCKRRVFSVTVLTLLKGGFIVTSLSHFAWLISTIVNATIKFKVVIKILFSCLTSSNLYSKFEAFCKQQSRKHLALKNCRIVG